MRFKGYYGSSAVDMVHSVQMDNLVHKDNTGWNTALENHFNLQI